MRLIDADKFKQQINKMVSTNDYPVGKAEAWCGLVDVQPTAYDINVVVEQLDNEFKIVKTDDELMWNRALDRAIEIVRSQPM